MESKRALMQLSLRWLRWGDLFCWQISRETNLWWTRLWGTSSTLTVWGLFMEASRFCCDNKLLRSHHSTAPSKNTLDKVSDVTATVVVSVRYTQYFNNVCSWTSFLSLHSGKSNRKCKSVEGLFLKQDYCRNETHCQQQIIMFIRLAHD